MKRLAVFGGAFAVAALLLLLISDFGDVPCQDGSWDEARQTCIPN